MPTSPTAIPPYAVPCPGPDGSAGRYALVSGDGRLVRAPDLSAVGPFHPDGRGGLVAPAADPHGRWGHLDQHGAWLAEPALRRTEAFDDSGLSRFRADDGRWGYAGTAHPSSRRPWRRPGSSGTAWPPPAPRTGWAISTPPAAS
ncbi:hypothetical protein [Kitasatospora sp. MBT63]|uniref:hypothetical protein n=1 Tax=Kitasatospora sp. MBT63 TaxID=1444768 RepID=UPI00068F0F2D|nr:hypothetical protein [Kitasatospora sp. MBT63]